MINKTTVIAPPPVVAAPPMGMGMGFGAPVVVAPPPTIGDVVVGTVIGGAINNAITGGGLWEERFSCFFHGFDGFLWTFWVLFHGFSMFSTIFQAI